MPEEIQEKLIEEEMKRSYMDYAMSVIVARAIPDVRDGLKPVHRRILFGMDQLGMFHNKPYKKSARIVGDVLGKFHPHGDAAIYDALVRMAQDFSLRYKLIDGHGNWGSIDGDSAASQRYTEARLKKIAEELLIDIDKDTVDFVDNFDSTTKEPVVLPGRIPNLLINGSSGIAVGMATNIPPHNIKEVCNAIIYFIDNKDCNVSDLMKFVKGPDFPTGGIILGEGGIKNVYMYGKGKIIVRSKAEIEGNKIIISEIPYMVNKSLLIEGIADLVRDKRINDINDIRDESDRRGMRIVIELKKDVNHEVVLNQLYSLSNLQTTFGVIMLSLVNGEPKILNLKRLIEEFVKHRKEVITRRTKYDLNKSEERAHILEGLQKAIVNIDPIINGIKNSESVEMAREFLISNFELTEMQANAVLDMKLQRLTSLETSKIKEEYNALLKLIEELRKILTDENRIYGIIKDDMHDIINEYGDERKTLIISGEKQEIITDEDLIDEQDVLVTVTSNGYIKQIPLNTYRSQRRGGTGVKGASVKEEDVIDNLFITSNLNYLLFFTNKGKAHWLKAYQVPEASRYAKGVNLVNLLHLGENEKVTSILSVKQFLNNMYLLFVTRRGIVKKISLNEFSKPRKGGIIAINLKEGDSVVDVMLSNAGIRYIICSKNGRAVKFGEEDVREIGRSGIGVRGIKLIKDDEVIGVDVADDNFDLLSVTENGYGKRTRISEYRLIRRGGKGVRNIKVTEKNGNVVGIECVKDNEEIICITDKGQVIRMGVNGISRIGRNTQGVRLVRLKEGDKLASVSKVIKE